jgi:threonine synthase
MIACTNCRTPYPLTGIPFKCPKCGGIFDYSPPGAGGFPAYDPQRVEPGLPGIWRYRHALGLEDFGGEAPQVTLGEGNTPLVWDELAPPGGGTPVQVGFKLESANPSGSFKDRGSALLVSFLLARGANQAVEDSSGNAGASFAAYAARAHLQARIFVPDSASGPKRRQIEAYGAQVMRILGPRSNAAQAALAAVEGGVAYGSHAYLPFNLPGYATVAYELFEQMGGRAPGSIIVPVGQGGLLLGMLRGFVQMQAAGLIERVPKMIGVQARACAPIWALHAYGLDGLRWVAEAPTVAEGIRVLRPLRGDVLLHSVEALGGTFVAVDEEDILSGRDELARRGFYVETTSAVVWKALQLALADRPGPLVAVLTGSGLKTATS